MRRWVNRNRRGKFTRRTRRRAFVRRRAFRKRKPSFTVVKPLYIGDCAKVKLRFTDIGFGSNTTGPVRQVYRGNSIWDPDVSLGGSTCMGWQAWNQFYLRYRVLGSAIKVVTFTSNSAANRMNINWVAVPVSNTAQLDATVQQSRTLPYAKVRNSQQGSGVSMIKNYISTAKMKGIPWNTPKIEEVYSSNMDGNPAQQWFWAITWGPMDGISIINVEFEVEITYYVEFYDRRVLPQGLNLDDIENEDGTYDPVPLSMALANFASGVSQPFYHGPKAHLNFPNGIGKKRKLLMPEPAVKKVPPPPAEDMDSSEETLAEMPPDEEFDAIPVLKTLSKKPDQKTLDGEPIILPKKKRKTVK